MPLKHPQSKTIMSERTGKQIEAEIKALEACKTYAPRLSGFGDDNHRELDLQIQVLRDDDIDVTADEFYEEYNIYEQSAIQEAIDWRDGETDETPSSGWDHFKPKDTVAGSPKHQACTCRRPPCPSPETKKKS